MKLLKNILLATDLSKSSEYVVEEAIDLAKIFHSEITLIYVLPDDIRNAKSKELLQEFSLSQLNSIQNKIIEKGVKTKEPILEFGNFTEKVTQTSEKINANLIIIGAGEKLNNNTFLLGANAEKIIKKSTIPVYVVKNKKQLNIKTILCPVDFSKESKRALKNAITLAHRFKAKLVILTVFEVSHLYSIQNKINLEEQIDFIRKAHQKDFDAFLKTFNLIGIDTVKEIKQGVPNIEILNTAKEFDSDLVIMGTTGKSGISKILMGSVTEKVIRQLPCSFITLKNKDLILLELESKINNIEQQFKVGQQLYENGFYEESISAFKNCLDISFMHIPSIKALGKVYKKLGDQINEEKYKKMAIHILERMNYEKIEKEVRKNR